MRIPTRTIIPLFIPNPVEQEVILKHVGERYERVHRAASAEEARQKIAKLVAMHGSNIKMVVEGHTSMATSEFDRRGRPETYVRLCSGAAYICGPNDPSPAELLQVVGEIQMLDKVAYFPFGQS